jgi:hypothetical protein
MAKEDLKALDIDQLRRKTKKAGVILGILIGACIINILVVILILSMGKSLNIATFGPVPGALFIALIIFRGKKEIDEEIASRESKS